MANPFIYQTINQPFGLGDILFLFPAVRRMADTHFERLERGGLGPDPRTAYTIWPVEDQFLWIADYLKHPQIRFVGSDYVIEHPRLMKPFRYADHLFPQLDCMRAKYELAHTKLEVWKTLTWRRYGDKEQKLIEVLGIDRSRPYGLINRHFANPSLGMTYSGQFQLNPAIDQWIEQRYVEGFTLLDWAGVYEGAVEIHTVSTSNFYILSVLETQAELHLYPRQPLETTLDAIRPIIDTTKWILHE